MEQEGPSTGSQSILETLSSRTVAFQLTLYDWDLLNCIHQVYICIITINIIIMFIIYV